MNEYSSLWFETFLAPIPEERSAAEADFIARQLPRPPVNTVLDLCCGTGRHARLLAARGYTVTGVDRDNAAIAEARRHATSGNPTYHVLDMRRIDTLPGMFDAVICLWQSFGYLDAATNTALLRRIAGKLTPHGRLILDLYHRDFFAQHQGTTVREAAGRTITEQRTLIGDRLTVTLDYGNGPTDRFSWQIYTPDEIRDLAEQVGMRCLLVCTNFDERTPASPDAPRMQIVLALAGPKSRGVDRAGSLYWKQ